MNDKRAAEVVAVLQDLEVGDAQSRARFVRSVGKVERQLLPAKDGRAARLALRDIEPMVARLLKKLEKAAPLMIEPEKHVEALNRLVGSVRHADRRRPPRVETTPAEEHLVRYVANMAEGYFGLPRKGHPESLFVATVRTALPSELNERIGEHWMRTLLHVAKS